MYFLTLADLEDKITNEDLEIVTGGNNSLIDNAELKAMAEIDSFLGRLYDMPKAWVRRGTMRNKLLMQYSTIILLYHLHARISPNNVPSSRLYEYDSTLKMLKELGAGKYSIDLPLKPNKDEDGTPIITPSTFIFLSEPYTSFFY